MLKRFTVSFRYQVETVNLRFNLFIINSIKNWTDEKMDLCSPGALRRLTIIKIGTKLKFVKKSKH